MPRMRANRRLERRGNVLLLVALAMVPLLGMVALAIDFGRTAMVKSKLDLAADAAALLAATAGSNAWLAGDANAVEKGIAAAQARFQAQSGNQSDVAIGAVDVGLTRNGGLFNATVTYTAQEPTTVGWVLGIAALPISGQSSASLSLNPFVDVQILMDASSSMTLAATPEAITAMQNLTATFRPVPPAPDNVSTSCTFACHWSATNVDFYKLALMNNVQLRITVLQTAVADVINTLASLDTNNRFQLGLYSFNKLLNVNYSLSHDIPGAMASLSTIAPDVNFCSNDVTCPDTYFSSAMAEMTALDQSLPQQGSQAPQRFLFLVSDGVYDQYVSGQRQIGAFDPADCAALKALGVSILVLHTPYTPIPSNGYYMQHVDPTSKIVVSNLQACASSPDYYFVATDATEIAAQMRNMLQLVVRSTSHLTH